ncbi:MAG: metallophosphoesterase [Bdellovibrio sp.]|nr:metallophosphoesterase [Bdellovibrio sp.]
MRLILYISVFVLLCTLVFSGLYHRFVKPIQNKRLKKILRICLILFFAFLILPPWIYRIFPAIAKITGRREIMNFYFFFMGLLSFTTVYLFAAAIAEKILWLGRKKTYETLDPKRRLFLTQMFNMGILSLSGVSTAVGGIVNMQPPTIFDIKIPLKMMPDDLKNFKIVQISDIHIGPLLGREFLEDLVSRVNQLKPSLIAITGDLVDGRVSQIGSAIEVLSHLKSEYGTYFVSGNHEYYSGHDEWMKFLKQLGIKILENENDFLQVGNATVLIGGVPDYRTSPVKGDPHRAIFHVRGKADLSVLMSHQPLKCDEARKAGFNLQLSGHTHAGQFHPWTWVVKLIYPYVKGLNDHMGMWIYVNQGTGFWGPPIRLGTKSEITQFQFEKSLT